MARRFIYAVALAFFPAIALAQSTVGVNPVFVRAQTMVNDGNAAAGRALVDSMIAIAAPGSNDYAEGVYWRAVLAATAVDAEADYRRIVVDYSQSPRVEDALIRLAQLEIARANYDGALRHLNRLVAEHPESPSRARAGYWMARAMFDKNDVPGGCAATADALARTNEGDAELKNQITYLNQRCAGVALPGTVATPTVTPSPVGQTVTEASPPPAPVVEAPKVTATPEVSRDTARVATRPSPAPAPPPARAPVTTPARTTPAEPPARDEAPVATTSGSRAWSVQVAAYNTKPQADVMVATLKKNGYEARVDGTAAPFRVRIGQYKTQGQASAVQRSLKAKKIEGFVVQADTR
jgi:cell division septation protein DedD